MNRHVDKRGIVYTGVITSLHKNIHSLLDAAGLTENIGKSRPILIKPNLVESLPPPITTPVDLVEIIVDYLQHYLPGVQLIIGEGTGSMEYDTFHCFTQLGYEKLARKKKIELVDLNRAELVHKEHPDCRRWPSMHLPKLLDQVFLFSVPVLKAHTLAKVTLTMKNMMGCAPPSHYQGNGAWGKSSFHTSIHEAIFDLNRYRTPDFTLLDGSIGMATAHLWGPTCDPPVNRLAASWDPVAIDSYGASLLNRDWQTIGHIRLAHDMLGRGENLYLHEI